MTEFDRSQAQALADRLRQEISTVIVGQEDVVEDILTALAAGGHALLEGVPGLAKTLLISTLAKISGLSFNRIQFTPDLMPADITGTEVIREDKTSGSRELVFLPGPVFASVVLADEINRTPPKTQAAMLEAMQERQVSAGGQVRPLPAPFFVLATQNPIEQEGTYPLPEAQLDRFLLKIAVGYPSADEELAIVTNTTGKIQGEPQAVTNAEELLALQRLVRETAIAEPVARYAIQVVRATRNVADGGHAEIAPLLRWGAGPRAGQAMVLAAKARATLAGRNLVTLDDIRAAAPSVLRHRLLASYAAEAEGVSGDSLIERLLTAVELPSTAAENEPALATHLN